MQGSVVMLPDGRRVYDNGTQWQVQAPVSSAKVPWRTLGYYMGRDPMVRQLPERLWGPSSGRVLPDDVLALLKKLPPIIPPSSP